jgi:O-antigen/teichoic acid export membrane protein
MTSTKYISNLNWSFLERVIHIVNVLIVGVLLARYLGPERLGVLTYVQSYIAIFGFLVGLGLDNVAIREIVKYPKKSGEIVGTSLGLMLITFFFVILLVNITSNEFENTEEINLLIAILSLGMISHVFAIFVCYARAKVNIKSISVAVILSEIVLLIVKIILIEVKAPLLYFVIIDTLNILILSICFTIFYRQSNDPYKSLSFSIPFARKILKDSWPLMLSSGVIIFYMRVDQIMIKEMLTFSELGSYAVSVRISESWYFLPMIITITLFPMIITAKELGEDEYKLRMAQLFSVTIWIAILMSLIILIFSENIISILFGEEFGMASEVLKIQAFAGIFVAMGYVNGKWMVAENYTKLSLLRHIYGLIINFVLNLILIPLYGINGAAISTLVAVLFSSNLLLLFFKSTKEIFIMQNKSIFNFGPINIFHLINNVLKNKF